MVTLSGFADEISQDLDEQLGTLESLGIRHLELRGVWGKNVLDLSDEELDRVKAELGRRGRLTWRTRWRPGTSACSPFTSMTWTRTATR